MADGITRREVGRRAAAAAALGMLATQPHAADERRTTLIVRADDLGSSHAANLACIEAYKNGIARAVEIMMPCAWVPEAVKLLAANPGLDPGVHLTLTSEWELCKWRPLTHCPSLVDADGFFLPTIWPSARVPDALKARPWKLEEVERELAAQVALATKKIPHLSHISAHMGCDDFDPRVNAVVEKLAKEHGLLLAPPELRRFPLERAGATLEARIAAFVAALRALAPGARYLFVEHPAYDTPEMRPIGHEGYRDVAQDRDMVTKLMTSPEVVRAVAERGIRLAGYRDAAQ
jgi:chitin disaccharide deacetylase